LVPAAGRGERLGPGGPKALRLLAGEPLVVHAVQRLSEAASTAAVVVAAPAADVPSVRAILAGRHGRSTLVVVAGGRTRQESVAAALAAAPADLPVVLVHDAARCLVPPGLVDLVAAAVRGGQRAVIPVLPVSDTVKQVDSNGVVVATLARATLRSVQTPQGFSRDVLAAAHRDPGSDGGDVTSGDVTGGDVTDDAGLVERLGVPVHTVAGRPEAFKVTGQFDLAVASAILASGAAAGIGAVAAPPAVTTGGTIIGEVPE
jgi:2-C-methyl-D-erythritol 4-phosphate cytidylyltransferase